MPAETALPGNPREDRERKRELLRIMKAFTRTESEAKVAIQAVLQQSSSPPSLAYACLNFMRNENEWYHPEPVVFGRDAMLAMASFCYPYDYEKELKRQNAVSESEEC